MTKIYLVQSGDRYYGYDSIEQALKDSYREENTIFEAELKSLGNFKLTAVEIKTVTPVGDTENV